MVYKIVCTGNPDTSGIAKYLKIIYPTTIFVSRGTGYDLSTYDGIEKFTSLLSDCNIFINHSQLPPTGQQELLLLAKKHWTQGHVITIGSVLEFEKWKWIEPEVHEEKNRLKNLSLELSEEYFKTTYITIGGLKKNDNDQTRLDPKKVAEVIKWIIESDLHIPLIYVDRLNNNLTQQWLNKNPNADTTNKDLL
jgi:hypothetical protein